MLRHDVEAALAAWRRAERTLAELTPGTPAYADAEVAVEDAKRAYSTVAAERSVVVGRLGEVSAPMWTAELREAY